MRFQEGRRGRGLKNDAMSALGGTLVWIDGLVQPSTWCLHAWNNAEHSFLLSFMFGLRDGCFSLNHGMKKGEKNHPPAKGRNVKFCSLTLLQNMGIPFTYRRKRGSKPIKTCKCRKRTVWFCGRDTHHVLYGAWPFVCFAYVLD